MTRDGLTEENLHDGSVKAVSYTHLDVYKRQVLQWEFQAISSCVM